MGARNIAHGGADHHRLRRTAGVAAAAATSTPATPPSPEAAEQARKIAVAFSFTTSLSLLIGAFVGAAAGALGGFHRDEA